jgi:hypothetical protein
MTFDMEQVPTTMTDLLREPKEVFAELPDREVLLHRPKGRDVLMVDAAREGYFRDTFSIAVAALAVGLMDDAARSGFGQRLPMLLPWTTHLTPDERLEFLDELATNARSAFDLGDFSVAARVLRDWKTTARLYATDETRREALEPVIEEPEAQTPLASIEAEGSSLESNDSHEEESAVADV